MAKGNWGSGPAIVPTSVLFFKGTLFSQPQQPWSQGLRCPLPPRGLDLVKFRNPSPNSLSQDATSSQLRSGIHGMPLRVSVAAHLLTCDSLRCFPVPSHSHRASGGPDPTALTLACPKHCCPTAITISCSGGRSWRPSHSLLLPLLLSVRSQDGHTPSPSCRPATTQSPAAPGDQRTRGDSP